MKIDFKYLFILTFIIVILFLLYSIYYTYSGVNLISSAKAKQMIQNNEVDYIVDVRTQLEWSIGHYKDAIHIPINSINESTLPVNYNQSVFIVYCNTGQRARIAAEKMEKLGVKKVYYIAGTYKSLE